MRPQDTLYSIAWRHNLDYRELAKWNHLGADYRLTVGQVLVLSPNGYVPGPRASQPPSSAEPAHSPEPVGSREAVRGAPPSRAAESGHPAPHAQSAPSAREGQSAESPNSSRVDEAKHGGRASSGAAVGGKRSGDKAAASGLTWVWPTDEISPPRPVPGGGILLLGRLGQDIRAAGSGRVVYSGNGIRGYGNLIIIKHGDSLLSSYAHNRETLVHEGEEVSAGQVIAHMGTGAHQISALYFEIRVNGKPTDPLRYLGVHR